MAYQLWTLGLLKVDSDGQLPPFRVFWGLRHGKSYQSLANKKSYPTAATASVIIPNFECYLLSSSCGRAAARTKPGSQMSAPHSANYRLQFLFWLNKGRLNGTWMLFFNCFSLFCVHPKLVPPNPFLPAFLNKKTSPIFLPLIFHTLLVSKNKSWSELGDSTTFSSPVDAQQFGSWNSISSSSGGGTAMGKISCMSLGSTRACSMTLAATKWALGHRNH